MKRKVRKKVWHVFRFKERYELPDDMRSFRQSGLLFTRDFVGTAGGDEAVGYHNSFGLLSNNDGLEYAMLYGLYRELINMAAQHSRARRGYLLNASGEPLKLGQIAKLLNIPPRDMQTLLYRLKSVKLMEYIHLPKFDMTLNDDPRSHTPKSKETKSGGRSTKSGGRSTKSGGRSTKSGGRSTSRKNSDIAHLNKNEKQGSRPGNAAENGNVTPKKGALRNGPEISGNFRKPLKKGKVKVKVKTKSKRKQRAPNGATAIAETVTEKRRAKQVQALEGKQLDGQAPIAEAEPLKPRNVDAPGPARRVIPFERALGSISPAEPGTGESGAVYDRHDFRTGVRVYSALGYRWSIDSQEGRREICSFASTIHKLLERLRGQPPTVVDEFALRMIREAVKIGRRRSKQNCGAVWTTVVCKIADARLRTDTG